MKFIYKDSDGMLCVVIPAPKENIEKQLGEMSQAEYVAHVLDRSIPEGATGVREVQDEDVPLDREFRGAWVDATPESNIDISCEKAVEIKLNKLRERRAEKFKELDAKMIIALETGVGIEEVKQEKQRLREITDPLKGLDVVGKVNDTALLENIKVLSEVEL